MSHRPGSERVAILAPMPDELRPVVRRLGLVRTGTEQAGTEQADLGHRAPAYSGQVGATAVVATRTGIGPERAGAATEALLASRSVDRVIVVGIAGGLVPASAVGDLVVPEAVVDGATGDRFAATPTAAVALRGVIRTVDASAYQLDDEAVARLVEAGTTAVDMETAAIARVCETHGVPWLAFRAISDLAGDASMGPVLMTLVDTDGRPKPWTALRFVATHPGRIPSMVRLARDARAAAATAADAAAAHLTPAGGPDHDR